jgi:pSer/pThr/pTyr-binding forkhead associated (FHA) protein
MIKCPSCSFEENPDTALACARCHRPLIDSRASLFKRPTTVLTPAQALLEPRVRDRHVGHLQRNDIALYISDMEEPLIVSLTRDLILGRYGGVEQQPPIDLAAFEALEHGVSRKHAMLRRFNMDVAVIDLGSTNGTWLNGVRIMPHQPVILRNGDRLSLARLPIQVYTA